MKILKISNLIEFERVAGGGNKSVNDILSALELLRKKNASSRTIAFFVVVDADFADFKSMSHQYNRFRNRKLAGNGPEVHVVTHY